MAVNIDKSILDEIAENLMLHERLQQSELSRMPERQWYIDGIQYVLDKLGYVPRYKTNTELTIVSYDSLSVPKTESVKTRT